MLLHQYSNITENITNNNKGAKLRTRLDNNSDYSEFCKKYDHLKKKYSNVNFSLSKSYFLIGVYYLTIKLTLWNVVGILFFE